MHRRDFLARLGGGMAASALCARTLAGEKAAMARPNIVIVLSDDMGFSDIGCYGGEIATPMLDGLAAKGIRFTQFFNTARCCPSRASLLTGLHPHQANVGHMTNPRQLEGYGGDLSRNAVTLAEALRPAGYRTYMTGKWHVACNDGPKGPKHNWPLQRGFEKFYGTITGAGSFYDPTTLCRGNDFITPDNDPRYKPKLFYYTDAITDNAIAFLQEHATESPDKPFLLYMAYTAAHWPMHALPEDIAKYKGKYDGGYEPIRRARFERAKQMGIISPKWELSPQAGDWDAMPHKAWEARCMEVYAAMVDRMDQGIGRVVAELAREGRLDNTLILYLQDNGGCAEGMGRGPAPRWDIPPRAPMGPDELQPHIWPPMHTRDGKPVRGGPTTMPGGPDTYVAYGRAWANVSNTPFREYKHWVHEGGIATPLVAHWPAGIAPDRAGKLEHHPAQLVDLMATCVDLSGARYPGEHAGQHIQPMEGVSLAPAFAGRDLGRTAPLFWEHEGNRALRVGKWKLVAKGAASRWELYDMDADRTELHDLSKSQPERAAEMAAQWEQIARRVKVIPWPWAGAYGTKPPAKGRKGKAE